uniref:Putative secreted protein n=1 Tax=Ixodes ricinus TaxID=34613 RepID=A0A6B0U607_IXORI
MVTSCSIIVTAVAWLGYVCCDASHLVCANFFLLSCQDWHSSDSVAHPLPVRKVGEEHCCLLFGGEGSFLAFFCYLSEHQGSYRPRSTSYQRAVIVTVAC